MLALDKQYKAQLEEIKEELLNSELLSAYLDTEEEDDYRELIAAFEPKIYEVHQEVAKSNPLQLLALEEAIMEPEFEGLFLPKILGYAVLRGVITDKYQYHRPQKHFKKIVEHICNSANFEMLKMRIGQSLQMGLALSSDIWVTNLINQFSNKKIKYYLESRNPSKYHYLETRKKDYLTYSKQFHSDNYQTTFFPEKKNELKGDFPSLFQFLKYRMKNAYPHESYKKYLVDFCTNADFFGTKEHVVIFFLLVQFLDVEGIDKELKSALDKLSKEDNFPLDYYKFRLEIQEEGFNFFKDQDARIDQLLSSKSPIHSFIETCMEVHSKGYIHEDAINSVKNFYNTHPGSSIENECLRKLLLGYFNDFLSNIDPDEYEDYMEFSKIFPSYLEIFDNEHFLLGLREGNIRYVRKLLKTYTDKRGKDYQDIKKFVTNTFEDFGFYKPKEIKELFKTRRKKVTRTE